MSLASLLASARARRSRAVGTGAKQRSLIVSILSNYRRVQSAGPAGLRHTAALAPAAGPAEEVITAMKPSTGNDVVDALIYAAHRVRYAADARLRECGISFPSYKLMRALENSDRSMREISEILHNSPRTVTDMIDGLQARGLVDRQPHPSDRRVTLIRLTPEGRRELATAASIAETASRAAIEDLSPQEQRTLRDLLGRVAPAVEAAVPERAR